ncbi:glycosyltransferase family 4 protein [Natronolimnobius sp. AArcel1]|nr:glycosyltransferase family 4 protein [Natronolimnobius sp. AArcel1]
MDHVTAFTDTYFPAINGVTYTIDLWRSRWTDRYGRMDVVYPRSPTHQPRDGELPIPSVPIPTERSQRLGAPVVPNSVSDPEIVHVHTPFTLGMAGVRFARQCSVPVVASYHTVLADRLEQYVPHSPFTAWAEDACRRYERRFYDTVDLITVPSVDARRRLRSEIDPSPPIEIVSNGIDTALFRPIDPALFRAEYGINEETTVIGYSGRHSPEKHLDELVDAAAAMDLTAIIAGDGPSRPELEERAQRLECDVIFPGFLDRELLPALYSTLDVFVFPGRIETQGLVALEANACGTPVVAVDAGALSHTVLEGETGYHYPPGNIDALCDALERVQSEQQRLRNLCLRRREMVSVEHSLEHLRALYHKQVTDTARHDSTSVHSHF